MNIGKNYKKWFNNNENHLGRFEIIIELCKLDGKTDYRIIKDWPSCCARGQISIKFKYVVCHKYICTSILFDLT